MAEQYYAINLGRASVSKIWQFAPSVHGRLSIIAKKLVGMNEFVTGQMAFNGMELVLQTAAALGATTFHNLDDSPCKPDHGFAGQPVSLVFFDWGPPGSK
jgi:hypothetical protein